MKLVIYVLAIWKQRNVFLRIILLEDEVFYIFIICIRFWFYILSLMAVVCAELKRGSIFVLINNTFIELKKGSIFVLME